MIPGGGGVVLLLLTWYGLSGPVSRADVIVYDKSEELVDQYYDLPARFGPLFPLDGLHAYAVMASDVYGCGSIDGPPSNSEPEAKFVVLMARNNCTFFEKVMHAQLAGFDAAIVYNIDSDDLVDMSGDSNSEEAKIPAMFLGYYSAMEIKNQYVYDAEMKDFTVVLNRNLPFNINTHLLWPFVAIVVLVFLTMIVVTIVKCLRHRNRVARERLPARELRNLPVIKYNPATCRYDTCSICLDDYVEGERLRVLPCLHTYHTKCVDPWLTKGKRNCPMCKRKIKRMTRRTRRASSESDSSSGASSVANDDTTPLLTGPTNPTNGTFPQQAEANAVAEADLTLLRRLRRLFTRRAVVNERENMLPATVSAVVDMSPDLNPQPPPHLNASASAPSVAVFQSPSQLPQLGGLLITTPISSPLRSAALAQVRSRSSEGRRSTQRIGVVALPNVDFQGQMGGGVVTQIPPDPNTRRTSSSSFNRSRRRGARGGGGGGGADNEEV